LEVKILGYFLIAFAAALISAPISPLPKVGERLPFLPSAAGPRRRLTLEFITTVSDQLRVGSSPPQALAHAAVLHSALSIRIDQRDIHEDNVSVLRRNAIDGAEALLKVALFLELSNQRGTPLIPALDAIVESMENELSLEEELLSEIAGARATAVLMSLLPVLILLALHPFHFLFGTMIGRIAFCGALILNLVGRFWLGRITKSALAVTS
jgi:tight adherence protein B